MKWLNFIKLSFKVKYRYIFFILQKTKVIMEKKKKTLKLSKLESNVLKTYVGATWNT